MIYWLKLIRIKNLLLISLGQILISYVLFLNITTPLSLYILCTFFYAASGNIVNDIIDTVPDTINKPKKLIVNNKISTKNAWIGFIVFNTLGFLITIYLYTQLQNTSLLALLIGVPTLLYIYSKYLKQMPLLGNLAIGLLTALSILLILYFYPYSRENTTYIGVLSIFTFLLNFTREVVKDVEDLKGDKKANLKTLPILLGTRTTIQIIRSLICLTICFALIVVFNITKNSFKLYIVTTLITPLSYCFFILRRKIQKISFSKISNILKFTIALGIFTVLYIQH